MVPEPWLVLSNGNDAPKGCLVLNVDSGSVEMLLMGVKTALGAGQRARPTCTPYTQ